MSPLASAPEKPLPGGGFMPSRTQIVCLHEGERGRSIDPVFINALLKALRPRWIHPSQESKPARFVPCGGRSNLIARMPAELKGCIAAGADTTLMVWADLDDNMPAGENLKNEFWTEAQRQGITKDQFDLVVFAFAKDRLENWIEFLSAGSTDESKEGPRLKHDRQAADAAKTLADRCLQQKAAPPLPPSLQWSCRNWRALVERMKD